MVAFWPRSTPSITDNLVFCVRSTPWIIIVLAAAELAVSLANWSEPGSAELIVIVFDTVQAEMVILSPAAIDNVSVGDDARINELSTLIVEKVS